MLLTVSQSCKKDISGSPNQITAIENEDATKSLGDCERRWFGLYADGFHQDDTISQKTIIKNGIAQMPAIDWNDYHTGIYYDIPRCHEINGDAIRFEARVKNTSLDGGFFGYDVALQLFGCDKLYGSDFYSEALFVGNPSVQVYNHIWIGKTQLSNLPEMVHYFGDFENIALELKNHTLTVYREGQIVKSITYSDTTNIGNLKRIGIGFKGMGTVDWVKLYNSTTNTQIMQEDFDIDGKSNVKWY